MLLVLDSVSTKLATKLATKRVRYPTGGRRPREALLNPNLRAGTLNAQRLTLNAQVKTDETSAFSVKRSALSVDPTGGRRPPAPLTPDP